MATYTVTDGQTQNLSLGYYNPQRPNDTINVSGAAALHLGTSRGNVEQIDINLAPSTTLTGGFTLDSSTVLKVAGDASTKLILAGPSSQNGPTNYLGASTLFGVDVAGPGSLTVNGSSVEFACGASSDVSVGFNSGSGLGSATLDQPNAFKGSISSQGGTVHLDGLANATDYDYSNGVLTIYGGSDDAVLDTVRLTHSSRNFSITRDGSTINIDDSGGSSVPTGTALAQHVLQPTTPQPPTIQPAAPQTVAVHDNTTGADLPDTSSAYTGPVSGVSSQFSAITPDNVNVTALADSMFIKTGSGNDAIAVHGGTNVVDAGSGSNFLTAGSGFDTFFADARNIPAAASAAGPVPGAIWDTIEQFSGGDAVTLWGVGRAASLSWQSNQGAVGHTGLTMHANKANGTEVSLTFAGIDSKAGISLSYGSVGGVDYLYVKAV